MKISDILTKYGWKLKKHTSKSYYGYNSLAKVFEHPSKPIEFWVQAKEFWKNGKLLAKLSLSRGQTEVSLDEANALMIIDGDIAVHVG